MGMNRLHPKKILIQLLAVLVGAIMLIIALAPAAQAVTINNFNPGRIIDDSIFFNPSAMDASQIQAFLNAKVPTCDTNGTQPISSGSSQTRAQWAAANSKPAPPYTCLKDYQVA